MTAQELKTTIESEFGTSLTARQLWVLTKFAKHVRLRCRNNAAFNNCMNQVFPYARFKQVTKFRASRITGAQETYPGLSITVANETAGGEETEE